MTIVLRAVFHENNKYYPEPFLDQCLYKIQKWKVKINSKNMTSKIALVIILMI